MRFKLTEEHKKAFPRTRRPHNREVGTILRESYYYGNCWVVQYDGVKSTQTLAKRFVEIVAHSEERQGSGA
jgi:hypothetical protein